MRSTESSAFMERAMGIEPMSEARDGALAAVLDYWRAQTWYRQPEDWVFASPKMHGEQPYWPETLLRCYVQPAAERLGIPGSK